MARIPKPSRAHPRGDSTGGGLLASTLAAHDFLLLYDGQCGLCNRFVAWVIGRDAGGSMRFATLQGRYGDAARRALPQLQGIDSMVLLHRDGAWTHSTAVLEVARYLGGFWAVATVGYVLPRMVRDWLYTAVARVRYRVFGKSDACQVPATDVRGHFLD